MKCPRCKTPDLKPTLIEEYLASMGCDACRGSLVALLHYRHWAETQKSAGDPAFARADSAGAAASTPEPAQSGGASSGAPPASGASSGALPASGASATPVTATVDASDTTTAIACPKCARLMLKYKISGAVSNRVDVCTSCDEAWLDGGEWELLEALQLSHDIPAIFTDAWQRRIRHEAAKDTRREILERLIGAPALARVEEFKAWLAQSRHKPDIMTYLYRTEPAGGARSALAGRE